MRFSRAPFALLLVTSLTVTLHAQQLSSADRMRLDTALQQVVTKTEVPSASIGISRGGHVVYARAFGNAILPDVIKLVDDPRRPKADQPVQASAVVADPQMAYPVGSISKQFTAVCVLLLQERGKLRLDDPVAKWFPQFTRSNDVTVRNLLTHTSGYSDYAPQDYTIPAWTHPTDPLKLVTEWATKPLDFEPGTKWQYSNTNFELAALIVERASGQKFHDFLWDNVITPLKLQNVLDLDRDRDRLQVRGYEQHALGPLRPAILEAPGWYYGDGQLAMPVATLLAWDESIVHRTLLKPASYDALETEFRLKDGTGSGYGLAVFVKKYPDGHVVLSHSGEVGGFVSNNVVSLNDDVSFAALTNVEARSAGLLTNSMAPILLPWMPPAAKKAGIATNKSLGAERAEAQAQTILTSLQEEEMDPTLFTADAQFYFNAQTVADYSSSLAPLGELRSVQQTSEALRGGMVFRAFQVIFDKRTLSLTTYTEPDGRLEQFIIGPGS